MKKYFAIFLFLPLAIFSADHTRELDQIMHEICSEAVLNMSLSDIYGFNQRDRDVWVRKKAATVERHKWVLDLGAGTCPYREAFSHCCYFAQDSMEYDGVKLGGTKDYGEINFISGVDEIPMPDNTCDVVVCTEVLEHVPDPFLALDEITRVLKPGGRLFLTSSFSCGLNQEPYHFYTGFTPYWYRKFLEERGFEIVEITPNGGFFKYFAQESVRVMGEWERHKRFHKPENYATISKLFGELLPRFLYDLDQKCPYYQFTVGYHVEAKKKIAIHP